jgi:phospholipid transport system substrate-binding protein
LLGLLALAANIAIGASELPPPQQAIADTSEHLKTLLQEQRAQLHQDPQIAYRVAEQALMPRVDIQRMSGLVLGRNWRRASREQRQAFADEFRRLLLRTYSTALQELGNWDISFKALRNQHGKTVLVETQMTPAGAPAISIDYKMYDKDGEWLVYDIKIESISLVANYRSSFTRLVRKKGIDGLIKELSDANNQKDQAQT